MEAKAKPVNDTLQLILATAMLLLSILASACDHSTYNAFLQCLQAHSDSSDYTSTDDNITNNLFSNTNSSYPSLLEAYIRNLRFDYPKTPKPLFIITPSTKNHVTASVICSKEFGFQIRVRSGGHDFEGISYTCSSSFSNPFVILDLFNLKAVDVDVESQTARIMAGATLGELYYAISQNSRVLGFPAGVCPTVGVGGHISGGGYGNMIRKFGLSVDHVTDAEIVNADGDILNRTTMGEDLFWAIRGGGGASFGVLLSYTVGLVPVPETVTVFRVMRFLEDNATDLVYKWQFLMQKVDDDLFIRLLLQPTRRKGQGMTVRVSFIALFLGGKDRLLSIMNAEFPELGLLESDCLEMGWAESVLYWVSKYGYKTNLDVLLDRTYKRSFSKRKSDYVREPISKEGLNRLWKKLSEVGKTGLVLNPYGGHMSRISESETPFPYRSGTMFKIQYSITWYEVGKEAETKYLGLIQNMYEFMAPYVSKSPRSAYFNYRDLDIGVNLKGTYEEGKVYGEKYFGGNFDRLVEIKTNVDPDNFFRNEQSIPVLASNEREQMASYCTACLVDAGLLWLLYLLGLMC